MKRLLSSLLTPFALFIIGIALIACSSNDTVETPTATIEDLPTATVAAVIAETSSPLATPAKTDELAQTTFESPPPPPKRGPDFYIDDTVSAGDTVVTGAGPAGVAIRIVDVSKVGEPKGEGIITEDGTFSIEVSEVVTGNTLGIMLVSLEGSGLTAEDFKNNENYADIPMVGFLVYRYRVPLEGE